MMWLKTLSDKAADVPSHVHGLAHAGLEVRHIVEGDLAIGLQFCSRADDMLPTCSKPATAQPARHPAAILQISSQAVPASDVPPR